MPLSGLLAPLVPVLPYTLALDSALLTIMVRRAGIKVFRFPAETSIPRFVILRAATPRSLLGKVNLRPEESQPPCRAHSSAERG